MLPRGNARDYDGKSAGCAKFLKIAFYWEGGLALPQWACCHVATLPAIATWQHREGNEEKGARNGKR